MKKRLIALSALVLLFFCGSTMAQENNFKIQFNVKGIEAGALYVTFFGDEANLCKADEATFGNGEFVYQGYVHAPVVARIGFQGADQFLKMVGKGYYPSKSSSLWVVLYPGANLKVEGSLANKDFVDLYCYDGGENDYLSNLHKIVLPLTSKMLNNSVAIEVNKELSKEEVSNLRAEAKELGQEILAAKLDFLNKNPNSLAALWLIEDMIIRSEAPVEELAPFFNRASSSKYGDNYFYKAVAGRIEGASSTAIGKVCPSVSTNNTIDGSHFDITSLRGKYLIIDFWGTWCGPCVAGIPHMKAFREKHADKVELLGISNDKSAEVWKNFIARNQMDYPNILCGKGEEDFVAKFNVQGFPTKLLIDPQGVILYRESGESPEFYTKMEELISK